MSFRLMIVIKKIHIFRNMFTKKNRRKTCLHVRLLEKTK